MSTDAKTVKSYDDQAMVWAKRMRSGENIAHKYLEKPAMYQLLGDIRGKSVLCVGCGTGEECEYLKSQGAKRVVGIDISSGLIEVAKESFTGIEFEVMDMEQLSYMPDSFDVVYSSLTMHYVQDWIRVFKEILKVMKADGRFIFSTHHPIKWASEVTRDEKKSSFIMGFERDKNEMEVVVHGDYLNERKISDKWFGSMEVTFYSKPISQIFREVTESGFRIVNFLEPKAIDEAKEKAKGFWTIHQKIPMFMMFELMKAK